jgi:hypothetical protein
MIRMGQFLLGGARQDCVVLDVSQSGARVHLVAPGEAPEAVFLRLPDGAVRMARRRWQRDEDVGFEFLDVPVPETASYPRPQAS